MRPGHFEALAPVCPRCLHGRGVTAPLSLASVEERVGEHVLHGMLHCSDRACWLEFPVIDGVPVIVPDPRAVLAGAEAAVTARADLPDAAESLLDDVAGPGSARFTARYHLSLYAHAHYADWSGLAPGALPGVVAAALALTGGAAAPALDLGCAVGRGTHALAAAAPGPVIGADLNLSMLRFAQTLLIRGEARWPLRRVGLVHETRTARLPAEAEAAAARVDFWAMDAMALPFPRARFAGAAALNLLDSIAGPAQMLAELARVLVPGGAGVVSSPYDWSERGAALEQWLGGHSARGPLGGDSAAVLRAALPGLGLAETAARGDVAWTLRLHDRACMAYALDMLALRREIAPEG